MDSKLCLNCENNLSKSQNFCSNCGQSAKVHRFTLRHFFHEGFHAITHADRGLFFLLKELAIRPGLVAKEYLAGKRKKYFNPFTFFLVLAAFYVLSYSLSSSKPALNKPIPTEILSIKDVEKRENTIAIYERSMEVRAFMTNKGNVLAMIAIPYFAFFFWLVYYKRAYNYSEHLVANLMFVSFANLAFSLLVSPLQALTRGTPWFSFIPLLGFLIQLVYFVTAYKGLLNLRGFWAMAKITLVVVMGLTIWVLITLLVPALYVYQNSHFLDYLKHMGGK